jgi:hypothetical protein
MSHALKLVVEHLKAMEEPCSQLPLSVSFREQMKRLVARVEAAAAEEYSALEAQIIVALVQELRKNLIHELSVHLFLAVPQEKKWLSEQWFGAATIDRFPAIKRDVRDACQCGALAQATAQVFHSMRIVEHGLRALALYVKVPAENLTRENWHSIIRAIEDRIRELREDKATRDSTDVQFLSEAATEFRNFKDAWRNHVSHSRTSYDEQEGRYVLDGVKRFMALLAARLPADSGSD